MTDRPALQDDDTPDSKGGEGRADFLNSMVGALCETIENVVGLEDAETFISIVGRRIGRDARGGLAGPGPMPAGEVAKYLRDFKADIGGAFDIASVDGARITFTNTHCPFAEEARGRPSLCMMTTNVFGRVAADATGYARVNVIESIAKGDCRCLVTVELEKNGEGDGHEFFG